MACEGRWPRWCSPCASDRRRLTLVRDPATLERPSLTDLSAEQTGVADLLARLDADRREAFVLTQLLGLSYAEAADVAGCPIGTVRSRVARARADLVEALDDNSSAGAALS